MWRRVATQRKKSVVFSERFYTDVYSAERVLLKFLKDFVPVEDIKWGFVLWEFYCLTESPHLNITTNSYINNSHSLFSQTFQRTSSPYFIFRWKKHVLLPTWVRNASVGRNLVEQDTERPDVGLVGELPVADGLRSAPLVGDLLVFWDVKRLLDEKKCVLKKAAEFIRLAPNVRWLFLPLLPWSLWPVQSRPPYRCSLLPPGRFGPPSLCGCCSAPPGTTSHQPPGRPCQRVMRCLDSGPPDLKRTNNQTPTCL